MLEALEGRSVVEMSPEKDASVVVDENSTVETSLDEFDDADEIAVEVSAALSFLEVVVEFWIEACQ